MLQNINTLEKPSLNIKQPYSRRQINKKISQISNNLSELFLQNSYKFQAYLSLNFTEQKDQQKCLKTSSQQSAENIMQSLSQKLLQRPLKPNITLSKQNLETYEMYQTLEDGIYILMNGTVKIVSFNQDNGMSRDVAKQFTQQIFRRIRYNKQIGIKNKVQNNQNSLKRTLYNNNTSGQSTPSNNNSSLNNNNNASSTSNNETKFTVSTISSQFSLFHSINCNCLIYSNNTIIYRLQQDELKKYQFDQNKQQIDMIFEQNKQKIKNHSMLYHTVEIKNVLFRNYLNVENVAVIKKGLIKVWGRVYINNNINNNNNNKQRIKNKNQQAMNQIKTSTLTSKYAVVNFKQTYKKVLICQLGSGNIIIKGNYQYQVISANAQILVIKANQTFQLKKQPQWVEAFKEKQKQIQLQLVKQKQNNKQNQDTQSQNKKIKLEKVSNIKKKTFSKGFYPMIAQQTTLQDKSFMMNKSNEKDLDKSQNLKNEPRSSTISKSAHIQNIKQNNNNNSLTKNIKTEQLQLNKKSLKSHEQTKSTKIADEILNYQQKFCSTLNGFLPKNFTTVQTKQRLFFKVMSPYIIVSQKIGLTQMKHTRKMLKQKIHNAIFKDQQEGNFIQNKIKKTNQSKINKQNIQNIKQNKNNYANVNVNDEQDKKIKKNHNHNNHKDKQPNKLSNIFQKISSQHSQQNSLTKNYKKQDQLIHKQSEFNKISHSIHCNPTILKPFTKNRLQTKNKQLMDNYKNNPIYLDSINDLITSKNKHINYQNKTIALVVSSNQGNKKLSKEKIDLLNRLRKNYTELFKNYKKGIMVNNKSLQAQDLHRNHKEKFFLGLSGAQNSRF